MLFCIFSNEPSKNSVILYSPGDFYGISVEKSHNILKKVESQT